MIPEYQGEIDLAAIREFSDGLKQLVWVADDAGCREYFNPAWTRFTGLTLAQSLRHGWQLALHPSDLEGTLKRWQEYSQRGLPYGVTYRFRSSDDEYRLFSGAMFPIRDSSGTVRKWIGICDQADAVARADDRFKALADALPMLVWTTDRDDRLTFVNQAWYDYTGLGVGTLIEERNALMHPDDLGRLMHALRSGAAEVEFRMRRRRDGMYRWHLLRWERVNVGDAKVHRICTAIDIQDRHNAQTERERQLRVIAEAIPDIVWSIRADGVQDYANSALGRYIGSDPSNALTDDLTQFIHPDDREAALARWQRSFETGEPYEHRYRLRRHDGAYRWFLARATALRDAYGQITRWFGTSTDIDEERYYRTLTDAMPNIAWSVNSQGVQDYVNAAWREYTGLRSFDEAAFHPADREPLLRAWRAAFAAGEPFETEMRIRRHDGAQRWFLTRAVPMRDEDGRIIRWFGTSTDIDDQKLLYEREHRVSEALQSASLPKTMPAVPWLSMDAVYVPGSSEAQIGGDWYDAFRLPDGRLVFSIGDVAGSGLDAAVTMSNMRQIIRGTSQVHADPVLMLNAADRALRIEDPQRFVTAFVAVLSPVTGLLMYASAGHLPAYIRRADGRIEELLHIDLPLGLRERHYVDVAQTHLDENDIIVFYTDGLVESNHDLLGGIDALKAAIADESFARATSPALHLRECLLPEDARDDVAILTVKMGSPAVRERDMKRWEFNSLDADALRRARAEFRDALTQHTVTPENMEFAELVLGELLGNAVRHAPGPIEVIVDFSNARPVLHVIDEGPGFERVPMLPADAMSESGRGLYLVSQATLDFSVMRRRPRGSHVRAVLL